MPEHLRALAVILVVAALAFAFSRAPLCALGTPAADFAKRRAAWFAVTLAAFLAHDYWLFVGIAVVVLAFAVPRDSNNLALFFLLLFAVPAIQAEISGFGVVNYIFTMNYVRLLALIILLPAFLGLSRQYGIEPIGRPLADKLLLAYLVLYFILSVQVNSVTDTVRGAMFYAFIDIFLPYYVASRSMATMQRFRDALGAFALAAMILGVLATVEYVKHWLLYTPLERALGVSWGYFGDYLARGESLRAVGSTGQPIALGYVMAVAIGLYLFLRRSFRDRFSWVAGLALLLAGLYASLSRGPWLGAMVIVVVFLASGPLAGVRYAKMALAALLAAALLPLLPGTEKLVDLLPFLGTVDAGNVTYRQQLLDIAVGVMAQNLYFGSFTSASSPAMEALRQGQGIIDVVNTYIGVGLQTGVVGLALFVGFFVAVGLAVLGAMRSERDHASEEYLLGRALLATLLGILVTIFTTSSITVIPVIYWAVAGLSVGYARLMAERAACRAPRRAVFRPWFAQ